MNGENHQSPKNEEDFHNKIMKEMAEIRLQVSETRKDIQSAVTPKFLDVSIQTKDLIDLAIEIWRVEQRLNKIMSSVPEEQQERFNSSIQKFKKYLSKNDIEIVDHTNQIFNDGRNLDIIAVEKGIDNSKSIVKETMEPTILCKNQVVHKGKVIILEKISKNSLGNQNE
jgi:hypothetical protein